MARLLNSALSCRSFVGIEARWWFLIRFAIVPGFFIKPRIATKITAEEAKRKLFDFANKGDQRTRERLEMVFPE